ncbi:MAG: protein translocase subunit SecD [Clostridia bacterium]|nr:protein translocase subunit SecD [Clostridia bacterium]
MKKTKSGIVLFIIIFFTAILAVLEFASFALPSFIANGTKKYVGIANTIPLGIDLQGGYYAVLTPKADGSNDEVDIDKEFDSAVDVLRQRLDKKGYTEATITIQGVGADREIRVEVPALDENYEEVLEIICSAGVLTFEVEDSVKLEGSHVKTSYAGYDNDGLPVVYLEFTDEGRSLFSQITGELAGTGKTLDIKLDGTVYSSATVSEQITSNSAIISGLSDFETAQNIAAVVEGGRLEINFELGESNKISASLGENALKASVIAGAIGLLVIFAIMILKYRGLGIVASISLSIYTVLLIVLLALIPVVQLTLPGIAGIILSIGMAVDANVIIFERIREEYVAGKTVISSVKAGYRRAFVTIFDGNITTILAAIILWILCPGTIKGFAITLLIGVVLSMITAIVLSRFILKLLMNLSENNNKFLGLKREVVYDEED